MQRSVRLVPASHANPCAVPWEVWWAHLLASMSKSEISLCAACEVRLLTWGARLASAASVLVCKYTSLSLLRL